MSRYPTRETAYPRVSLEDTDHALSKHPDSRMRYAYFKTIARGGTCVIQSCTDLVLRRTVCYKTLRKEIEDDPLEQRRFVREARITAMLQHPNTIPTYELGRDQQGHVYFTMKLVQGRTLRELLDDRSPDSPTTHGYTLARLIYVLNQAAHALRYAHSHGVVHRDVKPENILIGPFGEVMVLDWGMAKVWSKNPSDEEPDMSMTSKLKKDRETDPNITLLTPIQGTPAYLSPEQLLNHNLVDHRSDIYCVGAILYEILSTRRMSKGETVAEVIEFIDKGRVSPPTPINEESPIVGELIEICMRSVARGVDDRYQSLDEMIEDLENWMLARPSEEESFALAK